MSLNDLYLGVGKRIQEARRKKDLTQARLGELVGLRRTSITNIEKGRQKLLVHTLVQIAAVLGVAPATLIPEGVEVQLSPIETKLRALSQDESQWVKTVISKGGDDNAKR